MLVSCLGYKRTLIVSVSFSTQPRISTSCWQCSRPPTRLCRLRKFWSVCVLQIFNRSCLVIPLCPALLRENETQNCLFVEFRIHKQNQFLLVVKTNGLPSDSALF